MASLYLDSSALMKLVIRERESEALETFLARAERRASSELARVELVRGLLRLARGNKELNQAAVVLESLELLALGGVVLERAARLPPAGLWSLDALHLATALMIPGCDGVVTYDRRLGEAAVYHGLRVWSPGA